MVLFPGQVTWAYDVLRGLSVCFIERELPRNCFMKSSLYKLLDIVISIHFLLGTQVQRVLGCDSTSSRTRVRVRMTVGSRPGRTSDGPANREVRGNQFLKRRGQASSEMSGRIGQARALGLSDLRKFKFPKDPSPPGRKLLSLQLYRYASLFGSTHYRQAALSLPPELPSPPTLSPWSVRAPDRRDVTMLTPHFRPPIPSTRR